MKNKKFFMYVAIIFLILFLIGIGYLIYINVNYNKEEITEYIPEEEITDKQLRNTIVKLYYMNKDTSELEAEERQIDSKELLENPYKYLVELLTQQPHNEKLWKILPENTSIKNAKIDNGVVSIEFMGNFFDDVQNKEKVIDSIKKTLKELNEVNEVKIINIE